MTTTLTTREVLTAGLRVIEGGQSASGAYIASPNFTEYHFAWLRDGAYVALAMDAGGRADSAETFHRWAATVIESQAARIEAILVRLEAGEPLRPEDMLPTRYTLDGEPELVAGEAWPNFQLDGYGTWMFALHSHLQGAPATAYHRAVELTARYLSSAWRLPCFDYWEEFGDRRHTSTLAAIAAGLRAASRLLDEPAHDRVADEIVAFMRAKCVADGAFVKGPEDSRVDASLISIATPFGLVDADEPVMTATIERIRNELASPTGGIRRYDGDTYYGGNPWLLLTAWLGWHDRLAGNDEGHARARDWVVRQASTGGELAEQIMDEPQDAGFVEPWIDRWGPVADPLLWSHAKFILMESDAEATQW
ncbi:glycoside hydrolase family 15 protein [Salinibacterium sp. ZJ450]|uniref:glycoside hydrolase family 15 protein n=1 Tax=Salinibacterium sp. ZJ450 TaxID=2708338 RepID=UPI00142491C1|nr:glycoside hydrolase family 15 protein [Salinibacterium sp. ZJ450]